MTKANTQRLLLGLRGNDFLPNLTYEVRPQYCDVKGFSSDTMAPNSAQLTDYQGISCIELFYAPKLQALSNGRTRTNTILIRLFFLPKRVNPCTRLVEIIIV